MSEDQIAIPSATVARAEMLLSILSQQAAAARAEAHCAELRLLLAEARTGTDLRLEQWLMQHAAEQFQPAEYPTHTHLSFASSQEPQPPRELAQTIDSWDQLLPAARRRLQQRKLLVHAEDSQRASKQASAASTAAQATKSTPRSVSSATLPEAPVQSVSPGNAGPDREKRERRSPSKSISALSERLFAHQLSKLQTQPQQRNRFQQLRGVVTSVVIHVAMIVLLALITLRIPVPPASLALETASPELVTQTLEIIEPLEMSAPEATSKPMAAVTSFDVTENFTEVTSTVRNALSELSSGSSPVTTAAVLASAAGSTRSLASVMSANASFFGTAASGNCFCYVIDGSGSMRGGAWEAAKLELLKSLASLKQKQRFYIVFFNRELSAIPLPGEHEPAPKTLYATPDNLAHAQRWIDTLRIDIGGPPNDALELAISKEPDAIYLLTDGVTQSDVLGFLRRKNRVQDLIFGEQVRVPIHTIAFYSLAGQELLKQIAAENNGQYIYVPDPRKR